MFKIITVIALVIFIVPEQGMTTPPRRENDPLKEIVDQHIVPFMQTDDIPGVAIGIFYQGNSYFYNYGVIDKTTNKRVKANSLFNIGSITKTFSASLLSVCIMDGNCSLDDTMVSHILELASGAGSSIGLITLEHLATHISGLPRTPKDLGVGRYSPTATEELWDALLPWEPLPEQPIGLSHVYSNLGFFLLADSLDNAFALGYMQGLEDEVFGEIGMVNTVIKAQGSQRRRLAQGYNASGNPIAYKIPVNFLDGTSFFSTAKDMLRYLRANLQEPTLPIPPKLAGAFDLTHAPYFEVNPTHHQRLGWTTILLNGETIFQKTGGAFGFLSYAIFLPDSQIAMVILVNKYGVPQVKVTRTILSEILNLP